MYKTDEKMKIRLRIEVVRVFHKEFIDAFIRMAISSEHSQKRKFALEVCI